MEKLEALDLKILSIISKNARIPFKDVAAECGVSRAAIHQHVQKMIDDDIIEGSGYHINPRTIGYGTCSYIGIMLEKGTMFREVSRKLESMAEVVECHMVTGEYTMLIKVFCTDNDHLMHLLNDQLQAIDGVVSTTTLISLEQSIYRGIDIPAALERNAKPRRRNGKPGRKSVETLIGDDEID